MSKNLDIKVMKVLYPPAANLEADWFLFLTNVGKASGKMKWRPEEGEALTLFGKWGTHNGDKVYKFRNAMPNVPVEPRDQLRYVCDRTKGIGPALETRIWDKLGADWQDVTANQISGLTPVKLERFQETLRLINTEAEKSQAIAWMMGKTITSNMATSAWKEWDKDCVGVVQTNPFRLAELKGYSFMDVDGRIREQFGIGDSDPRRIKAAILYKLRQLTGHGSTVIDWPALREAACGLVGSHHVQLVSDGVSEMFVDGSLKGFTGTQSIALGTDYRNESIIWEWVNGGQNDGQ